MQVRFLAIFHMDLELWNSKMETYMKESSNLALSVAMVNILGIMVINARQNGSTKHSSVMGNAPEQMGIIILGNLMIVLSVVKVSFIERVDHSTKDISVIIKEMELER